VFFRVPDRARPSSSSLVLDSPHARTAAGIAPPRSEDEDRYAEDDNENDSRSGAGASALIVPGFSVRENDE